MPEIISLFIGGAGIQIAIPYWTQILQEHHIQNTTIHNSNLDTTIHTLFNTHQINSQIRCIPRCLLIDTDSLPFNLLQNSSFGKIFDPSSFILCKGSGYHNWGKSYYSLSHPLLEDTMDCLRKYGENCDSLHAVQLFHSLNGGIGSGFGSLMTYYLRELFDNLITQTFTIIMSEECTCDSVVAPYNNILSMHHLIENTDLCSLFQNQSLRLYHQNNTHISNPSFQHLNSVISAIAAGSTSTMRFPGGVSGNLRKIATNIVPFPRLHFFTNTFVSNPNSIHFSIDRLLSSQCSTTSVELETSEQIAIEMIVRGKVAHGQIENDCAQYKDKKSGSFRPWIPQNFHIGYSANDLTGQSSGISLINSKGLRFLYKRMTGRFNQMFQKKAFLHHYFNEGMDEIEMFQANSNLNDLANEFLECSAEIESIYDDEGED